MASHDIKTFLVDGGLPGSGRSLATRVLADLYRTGYQRERIARALDPSGYRVYVWDAANDEPTGYQYWNQHDGTVMAGRVGTEAGALAYAKISNLALEAAEDGPVRFLIDLPAIQDSQMLLHALQPELLEELNCYPVWTLTRHPMSLALLADRVATFGDVWRKQGVVLRNTWMSPSAEFQKWETSPSRGYLMETCGWLDLRLFCLSVKQRAKVSSIGVENSV